jgi:hypothetical protein
MSLDLTRLNAKLDAALTFFGRAVYVSPHSLLPAVGERGWKEGWSGVSKHKKSRAMEYAKKWAKGSEPPPVSVDKAYGKFRVVDGHHRVIAARHLGKLVPVQPPGNIFKKETHQGRSLRTVANADFKRVWKSKIV